MVCLLYSDPEQIFLKCWNREKTIGQQKRSMRAFPHPVSSKSILSNYQLFLSSILTNPSQTSRIPSRGELRAEAGELSCYSQLSEAE